MRELDRVLEAMLFLSADPVPVPELADAARASEGEVVESLARLRENYAEGWRGIVLREVAGGFTLASDPVAEPAARRLLARPRTPPLTPASPTSSPSRGRRSRASAASHRTPRRPRCTIAG
jgi:segregation and condensation protein B